MDTIKSAYATAVAFVQANPKTTVQGAIVAVVLAIALAIYF